MNLSRLNQNRPLTVLHVKTFQVLFILCMGPLLFGQQRSLESEGEKAEEEVFDLPVFEVETRYDRGYISTNTTSGTSLNTLVRDLPMGLEVINQEFIEDVQATDMKEALSYSPGVFLETFQNTSVANSASSDRSRDVSPSTGIAADEFNDAVIIRGYSVPNQQRMGFRVGSIVPGYGVALGGITDSANIERQEVVRGPQALLYGINVLSGIVNIIPKKPLGERRTYITLGAGSDGYLRSIFDTTGPLIENTLNYRLIGATLKQDDWIDYKEESRTYYAAQLEYFFSDKLKLFLEGQYAEYTHEGIGPQFFVDAQTGARGSIRNPYDEYYTFGRDWLGAEVTGSNGTYRVKEKDDGDYLYPDLGPAYNVSGPDTWRSREEYDVLAVVNLSLFDGLEMELGGYYTSLEDQRFNMHTGVFSNGTELVQPRNFNYFSPNPEYNPEDAMGYGPGEVLISPDIRLDRLGNILEDTRYAYYWWYRQPTESESTQLRYRLAYTVDTPWFGEDRAKHTFTGGIQFTEDRVSFVNNDWNSINNFYSLNERNPSQNNLAGDPFILRSSIFDYSPIRYQAGKGELAIPGKISVDGLGTLVPEDYVARSGWIESTLWYRGRYAIYHGQYWKDRLTLIAGIRNDRYQVKEKEKLRIMDHDRVTDAWQGGGKFVSTPYFAGYGDGPYIPNPNLPDSLNDNVAASIAKLRESQPEGTVSYNFDNYQSYDTKTLGLSFRLTEELSAYYLYSEGVFPNSGLRDGAYQAFKAERTDNNEIGLKFEFLEGKISGRIAYWEINRENAVWSWAWAPAPSKWWGGPQPDGFNNENTASFSPRRVQQFIEDQAHPDARDIRYGVRVEYVDEAWRQLGLGDQAPRIRQYYFNTDDYKQYGVTNIDGEATRNPLKENEHGTFMYVNYHEMMAIDEAMGGENPLKKAFDLAVRNSENLRLGGVPIAYYGYAATANSKAHSASQYAGANVGYEETGKGVDASIIFSPLENYQIILGFSQQEREVTSFDLVPGNAVDELGNPLPNTYTTPYDIWVFMLGPDNFEDPADPSSLKSGAINGVDLSFVPQTHLSLWNKYRFTEGPFEDLEIGFGLNYYGAVPTSVDIGGEFMDLNPYRTPDIPERIVADAYIGYRFTWLDANWRIALNVYNLMDDTVSREVAVYPGDDSSMEYRRTRIYHNPRSFRISATVYF